MSPDASPPDDLDRSLEPVAFLSASPNRVRALSALRRGPADRRDLEDETGLTRATLSRTLSAFEERDWTVRVGGRYELTQLGAFVERELAAFVDRMDVVTALAEVARWFPQDGFEFDLGRLSGRDVVRPSKEDPLAPTNNIARRLDEAGEVAVLSYSVLPVCFDASWRRVLAGEQTLEVVFEPVVLEALATDPTMAERAGDLLASDRARVYRADGPLPYILVLADDVVNFCLSGDDGSPRAVIDTDDAEVFAWARERFEDFRDAAVPLDPESFAG